MQKWLLISALLLMSNSLAHAQGDAAEGKIKAYTCTGCHGVPGYHNTYPSYKVPKLGGQNYDYLVSALQAYQKGERQHATMVHQAESLSDQDIRDIATYMAGLGQ